MASTTSASGSGSGSEAGAGAGLGSGAEALALRVAGDYMQLSRSETLQQVRDVPWIPGWVEH